MQGVGTVSGEMVHITLGNFRNFVTGAALRMSWKKIIELLRRTTLGENIDAVPMLDHCICRDTFSSGIN